MSCSDELLIHSCPLLCLQRQVEKVASRLFYCWSLLHNNNMATNLQMFTLSYGSIRLQHVTAERRHLWQVLPSWHL